MRQEPPLQFGLSTTVGLVASVGVFLGVWRLPPVFAAFVLTWTVVLAFTVAGIGALFGTGRTRITCSGAALALSAALLLRVAGDKFVGNIDWLRPHKWAFIELFMKLNGQDSWDGADMAGLDAMCANTATLILGALGTVIGRFMFRRAAARHETKAVENHEPALDEAPPSV